MPSNKRINYQQPHDTILAGYNSFLENSKLDENGNPFSETVFKISQLPDWTLVKHKRLEILVAHDGDPLRHKTDGPPSLTGIVRRYLNRNLKELSVEALGAVPWTVMKAVWGDALLSGQDNFRVWSMFASVYGHESDFNCCSSGSGRTRYRMVSLSRSIPIDSLITPISSPSFQWLVDLDLQFSTGYTRFNFLELPNLPNLSMLNISRHYQDLDIDDGIIRTWSMAASKQGKFTMLKILVARNHGQVTSRALGYLSWIKSLGVVDLTGCGVTGLKEIQQFGWVDDPGFADRIEDSVGLWEILRGEEKEKLVLQVKIEAPKFAPKRVGARTPMVFRREGNPKRKQSAAVPYLNTTYPPETSSDRSASTAKKPKLLRNYKKKDMGSLLAEFGMGYGQGGPSKP